jgi:hypothetical protein
MLMIGHPANQVNNVKRARRELDYATLLKWRQLKAAYPLYFTDHLAVSDRITALTSLPNLSPTNWEKSKGTLIDRIPAKEASFDREDFVTLIDVAELPPKPLPEPFAFSGNRIERLIPKYSWRRPGPTVVRDDEAWLSYGCPVHQPRFPFTFGFWDWIRYSTTATRTISTFPVSGYSMFDIGVNVTLSPACNVWFSTGSRVTHVNVGHLYEAQSDNLWRIHASIKFNGPTYSSTVDSTLLPIAKRLHGGQKSQDLVLVDQILLEKI